MNHFALAAVAAFALVAVATGPDVGALTFPISKQLTPRDTFKL